MGRVLTGLLFFGVAMSVIGATHYYFWARLVRDTALAPPWRAVATVGIALLAISMPLTFILGRSYPPAQRILAWPAFTWMGMMLLLLLSLLAADLARGLWHVVDRLREDPPDGERRRLMARVLGAGAAALASGLGVAAVLRARQPLVIKEVPVELPRLPPSMDGTTIVQVTDIHIGPTIGREFIEEMVAKINALSPDVIAITGDLVDGPVHALRHAAAPLADLRARHGVYFVTGNHEYFVETAEWLAELGRLGVRVLRNERVSVGDGAASYDLAGIDDYHAPRWMDGHGPDLGRAVAGRDPSRELVLLAHQPQAIRAAKRHGVGLVLSGHTHAGQIWPWGYAVRLQQPYVAGLVREDATQLYVSPGTGYWGPPMRLGSTAEITRVVLRCTKTNGAA